MTIDVDVRVEAAGWATLADPQALCERAVSAALGEAKAMLLPGAELSILLTDDTQIRMLNREWRGKDKPTNVLSFPAASPPKLKTSPVLGDIALAFETVSREADDDGKVFAEHATHLVVHGFLHILGYDHETAAEAEAMEALEIRILAGLGIENPYANGDLLHVMAEGI
ncbi:MAG: rRNA maturation RNase YbeY [Beijerinckiaceae bacterium]|nr:rRNA maturation RNase YbeY [Beijerinckiaceae bacterium]